MSFEMDGFDELQDRLEEMKESAEELDGENKIPFDELFDESFMRSHTEFESFDELIDESPWEVESEDDFIAIPEDEFDEYVAEHSEFDDWEEMKGVAAQKWMSSRLGF